jgi:serine/threonine protein kinase
MAISLKELEKNYSLMSEIGSGGMGEVYLATDKRLERSVAIKFLKLNENDKDFDESIIRFKREAIAIAKLSHPNIVNIFDIGEEDNNHYMIMEFLEGNSLANILKTTNKPVPPHLVASIGIQICDALECAHENNITHRDVKPENIILSKKGVVKLTDFGIAQLASTQSTRLTQQGSILGSFIYLSPEQLRDSSNIDYRTDIYSLGATLYELLTGRPAFQAENFAEVFMKIFNEKPAPLRNLNKDIPELLEIVILKAMAKEPENRFQSAGEMKEILKTIVNKEHFENHNSPELSALNKITAPSPPPEAKVTISPTDGSEKTFKINNTLSNTFIERNRLKQTKTGKILPYKPELKFNNYSWLYELTGSGERQKFETTDSKQVIYDFIQKQNSFTGLIIFDKNIFVFIYKNYIFGALNVNLNIVGEKAINSLPENYKIMETLDYTAKNPILPVLVYNIITSGIEVYKSLKQNSTDLKDYLYHLTSVKEFTGYLACKVKCKQPKSNLYSILHLEAEEGDQKILENFIADNNLPYKYKGISSIPETKKLINSNAFDVLILDYFPFFADSYDLYSEISKIPTIISTDSNDPKLAVEAMKSGVVDYIFKDNEKTYLEKVHTNIENILAQKKDSEIELIYYYGYIEGKPELVIGIDEFGNSFEPVEKNIFDLVSSADFTMDVFKADFNLLTPGYKYLLKNATVTRKYKNDQMPTYQSIIDSKGFTSELENSVRENTALELNLSIFKKLNIFDNEIDPEKIIRDTVNYKFVEWLFYKYFFMIRISNNQKALSYFYRGITQVEKINFFSNVNCPENISLKFPVVLSGANDEVLFLVDMGDCSRNSLEKFIQDAIYAKKENRFLKGVIYLSTEPYSKEADKVFKKYTNALSDSMMDNLSKYKGLVRVSSSESFQLNFIEYQSMVNNFSLIYPSLF